MENDGVAVVSGGLDSVTMLYKLVYQDCLRPYVLSFYYGQRHVKELDAAAQICNLLGLDHRIVNLSDLNSLLRPSGSVLVDLTREVPEGHYSAENMKQTVVPNHNMIMLSVAAAACVAIKGKYVSMAVHAGDHAIYPDCRPDFMQATWSAIALGNDGFLPFGFTLDMPFIWKTKTQIAELAVELDVPIEKTWSCYKGGDKHCGRCGTCVERLEALSKVTDPTEYEDNEYWRTQVANHQG
jgi:7-cyano-7-deazaguanine synthase